MHYCFRLYNWLKHYGVREAAHYYTDKPTEPAVIAAPSLPACGPLKEPTLLLLPFVLITNYLLALTVSGFLLVIIYRDLALNSGDPLN